MRQPHPKFTLFPYTTLFRSAQTATVTFNTAGTWYDYLNGGVFTATGSAQSITLQPGEYHVYVNRNLTNPVTDRKSTRLNSSHTVISYAVFCLKKKRT